MVSPWGNPKMLLLEHIGGLPHGVRVPPANFVWWWTLLFGAALHSALVMVPLSFWRGFARYAERSLPAGQRRIWLHIGL